MGFLAAYPNDRATLGAFPSTFGGYISLPGTLLQREKKLSRLGNRSNRSRGPWDLDMAS